MNKAGKRASSRIPVSMIPRSLILYKRVDAGAVVIIIVEQRFLPVETNEMGDSWQCFAFYTNYGKHGEVRTTCLGLCVVNDHSRRYGACSKDYATATRFAKDVCQVIVGAVHGDALLVQDCRVDGDSGGLALLCVGR